MLLQHPVADRAVALHEREAAHGRHAARGHEPDQGERPGQVAGQGGGEDQHGQDQHEQAEDPDRPVEHVLLEPLAAQQFEAGGIVLGLGGRLLGGRGAPGRRAWVGVQQDVLPAQVDAVRLELGMLGMHVRHVTLRPPVCHEE